MNTLVVGDIAGEYATLIKLIKKSPRADMIVSLGDAIDKGPNSKAVLDFLMSLPYPSLVLGNHEYMLVRSMQELKEIDELYQMKWTMLWLSSGGIDTITSFGIEIPANPKLLLKKLNSFAKILDENGYLEYLTNCPFVIACGDVIINHSPANTKAFEQIHLKTNDKPSKHPTYFGFDFDLNRWWKQVGTQARSLCDPPLSVSPYQFVSNRSKPETLDKSLQVFGHMSRWGLKSFEENNSIFAYCIDTSRDRKLTALLLPEKKMISVSRKKVPA